MKRVLVFGVLFLLPHCGWNSPATAGPPQPLNRVELLSLLLADSRRGAVDRALEKRGVDFQPAEDYIEGLRAAGARDELIDKVRKAGASASAGVHSAPADDQREKQVLSHLLQATKLRKGGSEKEAEEEFRAALAMEPDDPLLHLDLATVLAIDDGKREREAAIAEDRRAIRLAPDLALAHLRLAGDLLEKFDREGGAAEYRKVVRLDPDDVDACHRLGAVLEIMGDSNGAAAAWKEAASRSPDDASLRIELAYLLGSMGDVEGALAQAREAVRAAPAIPVVHHALARVLRTRGDEAGAAKEDQIAQTLQASNPPKRLRVGGRTMGVKLLYQPPPVYPIEAKHNRVEGKVRLTAVVAPDGTIETLKLISGPPVLAQSAADAVFRWRYQPTLLNSEMMEVETEIDVNFQLAP